MKVSTFIKKYTMVIALLVVFIFFTALTGGKQILPANISNLLLQNAYVLVMACGMLLCILTGGNVDLSVGSTLCLAGGVAAKMLDSGAPAGAAVIVPLIIAAGIGVFQGLLIGAVLLGVINQGMSIMGLPDQLQYIVKGAVLLAAVVFDVVSNHKTGKS